MDQKYKWIVVIICILIVRGVVYLLKSEKGTKAPQNESITIIEEETTWGNGKVDSISEDQFIKLVADFNTDKEVYIGEGPAFVDIYTTWCGPCKQLAPIIEALAEGCAGTFQFYKLDLDQNPNLAAAYNIHSIPYILYCDSSKIRRVLPDKMMSIIEKVQSERDNRQR